MIIEKYAKSATNAYGFVIIKPDSYSASVTYPLFIYVHGNGDRSNGSQSALDTYAAAIPSEIKLAVDKYGFICIAVQYADPGNNAHIDHALNYASANLMTDMKKVGLGSFSLGGGETTRYITTSLQNADKFAYVVNVGGINGLITTGIKYIIQSNLPILFFHSKNDPSSPVANTNNAVMSINNNNPSIPAKAIIYESNLHDVTNKVFSTSQYPWTGNEVPDTVWDYVLDLTKDTPVGVVTKSGPVVPIAIAENIVTSIPEIKLIGNRSRNYTSGSWQVVNVPEGLNKYAVNACGWIDCDKIALPKEGTYIFRLNVNDGKGAVDTKDITVVYSRSTTTPPVKIVKAINQIGFVLYFTDGTSAQAISAITDIATGKTTYKISETEQYVL